MIGSFTWKDMKGKHFQEKRWCTVTRGGILGDGFIYMKIYMKGKVFTKRGWGLGGFLGDRLFTWKDMMEKVFRKGGVLLQEGCSLSVGSLTWKFI